MPGFRLSVITSAICAGLIVQGVAAKHYIFDASQLKGNISNADIALFNQGGQLPGIYTVDLLVNGEYVDSQDIVFRQSKTEKDKNNLEPCLSIEQLFRYGVKVEAYPGLQNGAAGRCVELSAIPQARADLQFSSQQLLLSIPQTAMRPKLHGIAPEILWDDGMTAFLLNYRLSQSRTEYRGRFSNRDNSQYAQLEPGANLGAWRLRNSTSWQKSQGHPGRWQTSYTYAERGLNRLKSRLTLGERFTPSDVFDSVPFRGVMTGTDNAMVPGNMRTFSPVVRGIARTQARVEVKQNGYTIYNATVAPGPFALNDLATVASGGELVVTVRETDGAPQVFTVPYQTPAIALHEGYLVYNVMGGQYRSADTSTAVSTVGQATVMYGLPWNLTVYGGLQAADNYQSVSVGLGASLGSWGSLSLDGTRSCGRRQREKREKGETWRVRYNKSVEATNTAFSLASYQYASAGYNTLSDVLNSYRKGSAWHEEEWYSRSRGRRKSLTSLTLSQSLSQWGYISLNGSRENYWNRSGRRDSFGVSYGIMVKNVSLSFNWTQNHSSYARWQNNEQLFSFSASMPLESWSGGNTRADYQLTSPSSGGNSQQMGVSGQAFERQLNWNISQYYRSGNNSGDKSNSAVRLGWNGSYGQVNANYSYSPSTRQTGMDASGGMVISRDGITLAQPLDENNGVALIAAPGATGVPVGGWPGVKTDFRGYTILSYLNPYQENTVSLDPTRLPANTEITRTDVRVVPTKGAVARAKFVTRTGGRALITLKRTDGQSIPFGALAMLDLEDSGITGVVDEDGKVYLTGLPDKGSLTVRWGQAQQQRCQADYRLPASKGAAGLYMIDLVCY